MKDERELARISKEREKIFGQWWDMGTVMSKWIKIT
jgi:hypothetical protein